MITRKEALNMAMAMEEYSSPKFLLRRGINLTACHCGYMMYAFRICTKKCDCISECCRHKNKYDRWFNDKVYVCKCCGKVSTYSLSD